MDHDMDDDMDQAPSSSTGLKGDKKRFEVKKVNENSFVWSMTFQIRVKLDHKAFEVTIKCSNALFFCFSSGTPWLCGLGVSNTAAVT